MVDHHEGVVVMADPLREFATALFMTQDMPREDAAIVADHLVEADLRGVYSHGVLRVQPYFERVKVRGMNPRPNVTVVRETPGTAVVDGDNGAGPVVSVKAMQLAIEKAKKVGTGYVGVRGSNHFGACAYYAQMALEHDMIGYAATVGGNKIMAPTGGITPMLGNNPFGWAIPAGKEYPIVLDMALSVVAKGKIVHAMKEGLPIPADWALNRYGEPTTDAKEAFDGLVQPVGGYKGYSMSFVVGILGGILNRAAFIHDVTDFYLNMNDPQNVGHTFQAIDIAAFMDPAEFKARVDEAIQAIHSSELARGADRVYVPGEMEWISRQKRLVEGVPVAPAVWRDLTALSQEWGVPLPATI